MVVATARAAPVVAASEERAALKRIERLLGNAGDHGLRLVGPDGEHVDLPVAIEQVLRQAIQALAHDQAVVVAPIDEHLTVHWAAELLDIPHHVLGGLLIEGKIPSTGEGKDRRIQLVDLIAFEGRWYAERRQALALLTQMSQEMGLYPNEAPKVDPTH